MLQHLLHRRTNVTTLGPAENQAGGLQVETHERDQQMEGMVRTIQIAEEELSGEGGEEPSLCAAELHRQAAHRTDRAGHP